MPSDAPQITGPSNGSGAPTPGTTRADAPRTFQPRLVGRERRVGLSERDAAAAIHERRAARPAPETIEARRPDLGLLAPPATEQPIIAPGANTEALAMSPLAGYVDGTPAAVPGGGTPAPGTTRPQPAAPVTDPVFDLTVGGQPQRVALSELVRGYMRLNDYTQKTQGIADALRRAEESRVAFDTARTTMEQRVSAAIGALAPEFEKEIDWIKLAQEDPIGYARKDAQHKALQRAREEQQNMAQLRANEQHQQKLAMRQVAHDFLAQVIPGWRDPATREQLQRLQIQHLRDVGFTEDEIARTEILDPRHVVMLEESRVFRAMVRAHPNLLRELAAQPTPPMRQPQPMQRAGAFDRGTAAERGMADAQRTWDDMPARAGRAGMDAAVALVAARRRGAALPARGAI